MFDSIAKTLRWLQDPVQQESRGYTHTPKCPSKSIPGAFPDNDLSPVILPSDAYDASQSSDDEVDYFDRTLSHTANSPAPTTPLTPPTPLPTSVEPTSPCVTRQAKIQTAIRGNADANRAFCPDNRGTTKEQSSSSAKNATDNFLPKEKLFRNLTDPMNACDDKNQEIAGRKTFSTKADTEYSKQSRAIHSIKKMELEFIVSYDISTRLLEDHTRCIATKVGDKAQCTRGAKGRGMNVVDPLQAVQDACSQRDYVTLVERIKDLAKIVMCGTHYKNLAAGDSIQNFRVYVTSLTDVPSDGFEDFDTWIAELSTVYSNTKGVLSEHEASRSAAATLAIFKPWQPRNHRDYSVSSALREVLERPFREEDKKDHGFGFIYMFWHRGHFGHMKIGLSKNPEKRLQQWDRQCKRDHEFLKPSYARQLVKVPHLHRMERLIHVELKKFRRRMVCDGCKKTHQEWFEVEEAHAVRVFTKWRQWIETDPYEKTGNDVWKLRDSAKEVLHQVCELVPRENFKSTPSTPPRPRMLEAPTEPSPAPKELFPSVEKNLTVTLKSKTVSRRKKEPVSVTPSPPRRSARLKGKCAPT